MTPELTKNIITLVTILSIIVGFFIGVVSDEFFYATVGGIISYFYQGSKVNELKKTIDTQNVKIKLMDNGEKKNLP